MVSLSVAFDASGSSDDVSIASYAWAFGDGATGTGAMPSHTYTVAGSYTAVVTVSDGNGATDTASIAITVSPPLSACTDIFPDAVQNHTNSGNGIELQKATLINSSGTLATDNLTGGDAGSACAGPCSESGTAAAAGSVSFSTGNGSTDIDLSNGQSYTAGGATGVYEFDDVALDDNTALRFLPNPNGSTVYRIDDWENQDDPDNVTITFAPGDYYIDGSIDFGDNLTINISPAGQVRLFIGQGGNGKLRLKGSANVNTGGSPSDLFIYASDEIKLEDGGQLNGYLYAEDKIGLEKGADVTGALSAQEISLKTGQNSTVTFSPLANNVQVPGFCSISVASSTIDHFDIDIGGGAASTCEPYNITVSARDSSDSVILDYNGTVTLATSQSHGDWQSTGAAADLLGTLTPGTSDAGSASYAFQFDGNDEGAVTLALSNQHAEAMSVTVADLSAGVSSTSGTVTFSSNGFVVSTLDGLGTDVIAGRPHSFRVQMYTQDPASSSCSVAAAYNVSDVKVSLTRSSADPGGAAPTLRNSNLSSNVSVPNGPASATVGLNFSGGVADFSLLASDVGQYALTFLDDSLGFASTNIVGSTPSYSVRPFGLSVSATSNPGASTGGGPVFTSAGTDFTAVVTARGWDSGDDTNDDGLADFLSDTDYTNNIFHGAALPGFGQENPGEDVRLTAALVLPAGGNDPGLGSSLAAPADGTIVDTFSGGSGSTANVYYPEVGIIHLAAVLNDGAYLGAGASANAKLRGESNYVGRFTPVRFSLANPSITAGCEVGLDYSYLGQPFSVGFLLHAENLSGDLTQNYVGSFAKLGSGGGTLTFGAVDAGFPGVDFNAARATASLVSAAWEGGVGTFNLVAQIDRAPAVDGPFNATSLGITARDTDGVAIPASDFNLDRNVDSNPDSVSLGVTLLRFGRMRLDSAHGPETANLPVKFETEFWNGTLWARNIDDSCTIIAQADIGYPDGAISAVSNRTVTVGAGTTTGTYANDSGGFIHFTAGSAGQAFSAPGAGNAGSFEVDVNLSSRAWLRFDWDNNGTYNDVALPTAEYSFGSYRGHDRIIFWQEVFTN
jgi:MSHA biogenesis protein MshQ